MHKAADQIPGNYTQQGLSHPHPLECGNICSRDFSKNTYQTQCMDINTFQVNTMETWSQAEIPKQHRFFIISGPFSANFRTFNQKSHKTVQHSNILQCLLQAHPSTTMNHEDKPPAKAPSHKGLSCIPVPQHTKIHLHSKSLTSTKVLKSHKTASQDHQNTLPWRTLLATIG